MIVERIARVPSVTTRLGNYLRAKMEAKGLSQADLARAAELPEGTVSRYLHETVQQPKLATLIGLSEGLETPLLEIIQAAGFKVRYDADPGEAQDEELALLLRSVPWAREILGDVIDLPVEDQRAVKAYLQGLRRRSSQS